MCKRYNEFENEFYVDEIDYLEDLNYNLKN